MKEQQEYVQGLPEEERQVFQDEMQRELELARVQGLKVRLCTMPNALQHVTHTLNFMPSAPTLCSVCPAPYTPYTVLYTVPYVPYTVHCEDLTLHTESLSLHLER